MQDLFEMIPSSWPSMIWIKGITLAIVTHIAVHHIWDTDSYEKAVFCPTEQRFFEQNLSISATIIRGEPSEDTSELPEWNSIASGPIHSVASTFSKLRILMVIMTTQFWENSVSAKYIIRSDGPFIGSHGRQYQSYCNLVHELHLKETDKSLQEQIIALPWVGVFLLFCKRSLWALPERSAKYLLRLSLHLSIFQFKTHHPWWKMIAAHIANIFSRNR